MLSDAELARMLAEDRAQRARADHARLVRLGVVSRKFNPAEPREPHSGKWTSGPRGAAHAAGDALKLADRIALGKDEHLVASGRFDGNGGSDVSLLHAVVDTPRGREFRLGVIPGEDVERWRAGDKGSTVKLSPRQLGHLRDDLAEAQTKAKAEAKRIDKIWNSGGHPTEAELTTPAAHGSVAGTWGELTYLVHLTDDDPTSYQTTLDVAHNGVTSETSDGVQLTPADLGKLIKQLDGLTNS